MQEVKDIINCYFDSINSELFEHFRDDFSFGKMLRSKLFLTIAPNESLSTKICAIIEMIHFASLLHDDVIDNSLMRRGKVSINAKYGDKNAIMLGDIMYSKAFYEISCIDAKLAQIISNAVLRLSVGELEDVALGESFNTDSTKYIRMIANKTAALIEATAVCAGILSNQNEEKYRIYGESLGIAFQIIDDLLDITQDDTTLGKSTFSDFKEGKSTLPYIYLYEKMPLNERNKLLRFFKKELDSKDRLWIKNQMDKYNIIEQTKQQAIFYGTKALNVLGGDEIKLQIIVKDMIYREF
ncbi:MAG: polyprenyl synthetase family protein [Helicobacteraceae bacterium]|nr:polyprenyl synthetase family protein [Helicobacteraceae bacterium]